VTANRTAFRSPGMPAPWAPVGRCPARPDALVLVGAAGHVASIPRWRRTTSKPAWGRTHVGVLLGRHPVGVCVLVIEQHARVCVALPPVRQPSADPGCAGRCESCASQTCARRPSPRACPVRSRLSPCSFPAQLPALRNGWGRVPLWSATVGSVGVRWHSYPHFGSPPSGVGPGSKVLWRISARSLRPISPCWELGRG
jgi:hypothetical protein